MVWPLAVAPLPEFPPRTHAFTYVPPFSSLTLKSHLSLKIPFRQLFLRRRSQLPILCESLSLLFIKPLQYITQCVYIYLYLPQSIDVCILIKFIPSLQQRIQAEHIAIAIKSQLEIAEEKHHLSKGHSSSMFAYKHIFYCTEFLLSSYESPK